MAPSLSPRESALGGALALLLPLQLVAVLVPPEQGRSDAAPAPAATPTARPTAGAVVPAPRRTAPARPAAPAAPAPPRPVVTTPQELPPEAATGRPSVRLTGQVLDTGGRPVDGAVVVVTRPLSGSETFVAFASLGLYCVTGACTDDGVRDTTGPDGRFEVRVPTTGSTSALGRHDLTVSRRATGAQTVTEFDYTGRPTSLGTVRVLEAQASVRRSGGELTVGVPALPDSLGSDLTASAVFLDGRDRPVLGADDVQDARLDGRLVERGVRSAVLTVSGRDALGRDVDYQGRTSAVPPGPVPLSRGVRCAPSRTRGATAFRGGDCLLTDGDLVSPVDDCTACAGQRALTGYTLDLGRARTVSAFVLHGCTFDCTVLTSTDNATYRTAAVTEFGHDDTVLLPSAPRSARFVRVVYGSGSDLTQAREISVF